MSRPTGEALDDAAIGERLRLTREALSLKQREFAMKAGMASNTYNQFERGTKSLSIRKALALCDAYDLTLDWLYRDDPSNLPWGLGDAIRTIKETRQLSNLR